MLSDDRRDHRSPEDRAQDDLAAAAVTLRTDEAGAPDEAGARRSWSLIRGIAKGIAGAGALALLVVAALILWSLVSPPDPDASVRLVNGRLLGETSGYVARIDREGHTVAVSASVLGLHPVVLVVNGETVITVQDRQGGFGDLWKDLPVRASYEVRDNTRFARVIEIATGERGSASTSASAPLPAIPQAEAVPPAPAPRAVDPAPRGPSADRSPKPARAVESTPPPAAVRETAAELPARPARPAAAKPPAARAETRTRDTVDGASREGASAPRPDSTDTDIADGTAAIDWLIQESRRQ